MADFEGKKLSNDIKTNETIRADEVVASDVPPRYLFLSVKVLNRFGSNFENGPKASGLFLK